MHNKTEAPWYTQFWPWFLIALPATVVVAGFITLAIAIQNPDKIVTGNYQKLGTTITETVNGRSVDDSRGD